MNPAQAAAFVYSQCVCALAEIESMKAANAARSEQGQAPAYGEEAFDRIQDKFTISRNEVLRLFCEANAR
jgi:hypothetical protein